MTDAPERIWAMATYIGEYFADPPVTLEDHMFLTEYTRADLSDAKDTRINELEAKLHIYEGFNGQPVSSTGMVDEMADALKQKDKRITEFEAERDQMRLSRNHWATQFEAAETKPYVMARQSANINDKRIAELEAKLAKALAVLERIAHASDVYGVEANAEDQGADTLAYAHKSTCNLARTTLAEIQGNP